MQHAVLNGGAMFISTAESWPYLEIKVGEDCQQGKAYTGDRLHNRNLHHSGASGLQAEFSGFAMPSSLRAYCKAGRNKAAGNTLGLVRPLLSSTALHRGLRSSLLTILGC